mgnify:CR=1 FL=1
MSFPYPVMIGSPRESWSFQDGQEATVDYIVDWDNRTNAVNALVFSRYPGWSYANCYCTSVSTRPLDEEAQKDSNATVTKAILTATYTVIRNTEEYGTKKFISETLEPTAEFITLDYHDFRWDSKDSTLALSPNEAPGLLQIGCTYTLTKYKQKTFPAAALNMIGKVNSTAITPLTKALKSTIIFEPETLLFKGATPNQSQSMDTTDNDYVDITFTAIYRPNRDAKGIAKGWNWFWCSDTQTYKQLYRTSSSSAFKPFPSTDMSGLFSI